MIINALFTIVMLILAAVDIKTTKSPNHRDFKSIILTTGVLGTFVGIFIGLLGFDINSVENSIPALIEGLKVAFYTSIIGMSLSVIISVYQRSVGYKPSSTDNLEFIGVQVQKLDNLEKILQSNEAMKDAILAVNEGNAKLLDSTTTLTQECLKTMQESFATLQSVALKLDSTIANNYKALSDKLDALDSTIRELDFNFKKEIERLSSNFSADVISALNSLSTQYQQTIHLHFSENFKRFNSAIENLLAWQVQYKQSVLDSNAILRNSTEHLEQINAVTQSILKRDQQTIALYKEVSGIMREYKAQNIVLDEKLSAIRDLGAGAVNALRFMGEFFVKLNANLKSTNEALMENIKKSIDGVFIGVIKDFERSNKQIISDLSKRDSAIAGKLAQSMGLLDELIMAMSAHNQTLNDSYERLNKDIELHSIAISKNTSEMISAINKDGIKQLKSTAKTYFEDISANQSKILTEMSSQIGKQHEKLDSALLSMSAKYLEGLEKLNAASASASKDMHIKNTESIKILNDELANFVRQNSGLLKDSNLELLNILEVLQKQVEIACARTNDMQETSMDFMRDLETSLQRASDGFKGDYEWFLKRVREIIGQRI